MKTLATPANTFAGRIEALAAPTEAWTRAIVPPTRSIEGSNELNDPLVVLLDPSTTAFEASIRLFEAMDATFEASIPHSPSRRRYES
jgi:hypothetical protein